MQAHSAANRLDQLGRVVPDAVFEDKFDLFNVGDVLFGIAMNHDDVRLLVWRKCPDAVQLAEELMSSRPGNSKKRRKAIEPANLAAPRIRFDLRRFAQPDDPGKLAGAFSRTMFSISR